MPLQKQTIPVVLGKGIDRKTDPKQVIQGKLLTLQNANLQSLNRITKRNGYEELADVGFMTDGFATLKDDLIAFAGGNIYKYDATQGEFVDKEVAFRAAQVTVGNSICATGGVIAVDSVTHSSGIQVIAFQDQSATGSKVAYYQVFDTTTNGALTPIRPVAAGVVVSAPKTVVVGDYIGIFYVDITSSILYVRILNTNDPTNAPSGIIVSTGLSVASPAYDVCALGGKFYTAYYTAAGDIAVRYIDTVGNVSAASPFVGLDGSRGVGIASDNTLNQLWVGFCNSTDVRYFVCSETLVSVLSSTLIETLATGENIVCYADNGSATFFYNAGITNSGNAVGFLYNNYIQKASATNVGVASTTTILRSVSVMSKPFPVTLDGVTTLHLLAGYYGHSQGYGFLINASGNIVAKIGLNGILAGYLQTSYNHAVSGSALTDAAPPEVTLLSDSKFSIPVLQQSFAFSDAGVVSSLYSGVNFNFDFDSSYNYLSEEQTLDTHITGGFLGMYDGSTFSEGGFFINPEPPTSLTRSYNGATNNFPNATYSYVAVYEWFDNNGNFYQSAASNQASITISTATTSITAVTPNLRLTYKVPPPSVGSTSVLVTLYRTEGDGSIFYRLESVPSVFYFGNDVDTDTKSYVDTTTDAILVTHQTLYTTGGELDNDPPPAPKAIFKYKNRLFLVPAETPNTLWYTKSEIQGIPGVPAQFSSFLTLPVTTSNGDTTTGVQIDDKCVLFKESTLWYFSGDGPTANGSNNDFTPPVQIASDVGTTNPRSVVSGPFGAIFQSNKGFFLVDRSFTVSYIGQDIESYNDDPAVSSTIVPNTTQVRFLLESGIAVVYDYLIQQWYTYSNYSGVDAVVYQDRFTFMNSDGLLLQETPEEYSDNGQFITLKIQTSWLSFAQLQGFQRVFKMLMLGEYYSAHAIRISIAYDFDPNTAQTVTFNPGTLLDFSDTYGSSSPYGDDPTYGGDFQLYQFRVFMNKQKCETVQITIEDVQTSEIGQGFALSNIAFEVGAEGGLNRLPAVRSFG